MRVLQVNKMYPPPRAGIEVVVQDIAEDLALAGDVSSVLVTGHHAGMWRDKEVHVIASKSLGSLLRMPIAPSMITDLWHATKRADVVMLHHPFPLGFLAYLIAGRKRPLVVWYHADIVRQRLTGKLLKPVIYACLRRAHTILVASDALKRSAYLAPFVSKCHVIPFGISPAWAVTDGAVAEQAEKLRAAHQGPLTLHFGRLVSYKGLPHLIHAFRSVPGTLLMVGSGPDERMLKDLVRAEGLQDRVVFIPGPPDARPYFLASDVFVLPSVTSAEAFAVVQLEAMAYGKPVINTWLPTGVPEVSLDGVSGMTVEPGDEDALAAALNTLMADADLRTRLGDAGKERVRTHFSRRGFIGEVRKVLQAAARSAPLHRR